jgi:ParB family chromosome partitioning protein
MLEVRLVSPFDCRLWSLHDRMNELIDEKTCSAEIDSFRRHGQLVPVLGRPLRGDINHNVELIYGARRLFVARHLNMPLKVELRDVSDREGIIAMDIENRQRSDISPYERGLSYSKWIQAGHFKCQDEIARALKISPSQVSRLVSLAKLPTVVINAFSNPTKIREGWGLDILAALEDPDRRHALMQKARVIAEFSKPPSAPEIYRSLIAASMRRRKAKTNLHDEVVRADSGETLFRIQYRTKSISVRLPAEKMTSQSLVAIRHALVQILALGH